MFVTTLIWPKLNQVAKHRNYKKAGLGMTDNLKKILRLCTFVFGMVLLIGCVHDLGENRSSFLKTKDLCEIKIDEKEDAEEHLKNAFPVGEGTRQLDAYFSNYKTSHWYRKFEDPLSTKQVHRFAWYYKSCHRFGKPSHQWTVSFFEDKEKKLIELELQFRYLEKGLSSVDFGRRNVLGFFGNKADLRQGIEEYLKKRKNTLGTLAEQLKNSGVKDVFLEENNLRVKYAGDITTLFSRATGRIPVLTIQINERDQTGKKKVVVLKEYSKWQKY